MANPVQPDKKSVDLSVSAPRLSRIRRDPPPPVKEISIVDIQEREARTVVIGVVVFALALFVIVLTVSNAAGWSPSQYSWHIESSS